MSRTTLSLRLDDETLARVDALARATERTKTWVLHRALREYLDTNEWQVQQVEAAILEADSGDLISHEDVMANWEKRLADRVDAASGW